MSKVKIAPLGGMGKVTQNMFVYEYEDEMLIVDCGIGFPDQHMPGVDVLIPDTTYIFNKLEAGSKIVGMALTHGHDDHIAATAYLMESMPEFPIFASSLTAGFAHQRMKDSGNDREITVVDNSEKVKISENFTIQFFNVTHSVPDTRHIVIHTPEGILYHGSDFKLDPTPVDGQVSDLDAVRALSQQQVLCMMIDCLRVERDERILSEATTAQPIEEAMAQTNGKFIMTLMSSHIHRIQHTVNAAEKFGRKVVFIGRSVEQNVEIAEQLGKLHLPVGIRVDKRDFEDYPAKEICIIVAGSQGQEGSSLMRAVYGEHPILMIKPQDLVVFAADAIPGNEVFYYGAIDELCRNGISVLYPDIMPNLHQSGHASAPEQRELLSALSPKYVMPIGGADRHRKHFVEVVAKKEGFSDEFILLPNDGEVIGFENGQVNVVDQITLKPQIVDGLGVGDVGPSVLSDRRSLSQAGIVVVVIPMSNNKFDLKNISVISRGFVFMKQADEVMTFIKEVVATDVLSLRKKGKKISDIKKVIEKRLARKLYKVIKRDPMIVAVITQH